MVSDTIDINTNIDPLIVFRYTIYLTSFVSKS